VDFDYLIVGGGSAGAVIANRLSAVGHHRVAVLEAGPDTPPENIPDVIADSYPGLSYFDPRFHWPELRVFTRSPTNNATPVSASKLEQARVMGGGSSINGQFAVRGFAADYDEWETMGAAGWGYHCMLPYLIKLERDLDFNGPTHGTAGPMPIRRVFPESWAAYSAAVLKAMQAIGYPYDADLNGTETDGAFPLPLTNEHDRRVSTAMAYLDRETRQRSNLHIFAETMAEALLLEGRRIVGVKATHNGIDQVFRAREVIICAGALHSPCILMRAGIGPAAHLQHLGIPVVADVPGVGENLMDHPHISVGTFLKKPARLPATQRRHIFFGLRYSSRHDGCEMGDMLMMPANRTGWHPLGRRTGSLGVCVNKSYSRGRVRLTSVSALDEPFVDINMLADGRDLRRLIDAFKLIYKIMESPEVRACHSGWFLAGYTDQVRALNVRSPQNWVKTILASLLIDSGPLGSNALYRYRFGSADRLHHLARDDDAIAEWVRSSVWSGWHVSGTCRMGAANDRMAVLSATCKVRDIEGLRVADASIMPTIVRANTNITTIAIGEKVSDLILNGQ
jgi:5-(hydroxymethyl)furfural/furfural oxidase